MSTPEFSYLRAAETYLLNVLALRRHDPVDVADIERALAAIVRCQRRDVERRSEFVPLVWSGEYVPFAA